MKKFFGLGIISAKSVTGKRFAKVTAFSGDGNQLGELIVKVKNEGLNRGIFVKYIPNEDADSTVKIAKLTITSKEKEKVKELLAYIRFMAIQKGIMNWARDISEELMDAVFLSDCIIPESGTILIPEIFDISITNALICRYISGEWIGIQMKMSPEIQTFIKNLADKKEQEEIKEYYDVGSFAKYL